MQPQPEPDVDPNTAEIRLRDVNSAVLKLMHYKNLIVSVAPIFRLYHITFHQKTSVIVSFFQCNLHYNQLRAFPAVYK